MPSEPNIVIVGATGVVGSEMLSVLESRKVSCGSIRLLASEDSAGELYKFNEEEIQVEVLNEEAFSDVTVALFATSSELSEKFVPIAVEAGAYVIDNSSRFRMDANVPLVVPEINFSTVSKDTRIIANPNCSTIQLMPVLNAIQGKVGIEHVVLSTYQSVSGAGKVALDELWSQCLAVFNQQSIEHEAFQHQIAFNCIPQIDRIMDDGFTREEWKIVNESKKILGLPKLRITATAVRVPVFYSHAESVFVETQAPFTPEDLYQVLEKIPGVQVYRDPAEYPMQLDAAGTDEIHVGRVRKDPSVENGLSLWIVADNVRKGAALNAVQILERMVLAGMV